MVLMLVIISNSTYTYAAGLSIDGIIDSGKSFMKQDADTEPFGKDGAELQELSKFVSGVLLTIAIGVTVISGVVMGINFMLQSVEDKAKIKESMVPWIIGIFVSFGAFGIWQITITIFSKIN